MKSTNDTFNSGQRIICTFYASITYGSEYRSGLEFIRFAASNGFDIAIVADLDENSSTEALEVEAPGIQVVRIPSPMTRQATLYRYSDAFAQSVWHLRVARWLTRQRIPIHTLWIQNGAQSWLPLTQYFRVTRTLVWGPVGGGEPPPAAMLRRLPLRNRLRENLRSLAETFLLRQKFSAAAQPGAPRIIPLARTVEAQRSLSRGMHCTIPIVPEILDPLHAVHVQRTPSRTPRLLWVGQDIPRKNLQLALDIFHVLRSETFPDATLDVFGCMRPTNDANDGVTYHGWVARIDWAGFQNDGVLLLTSFREGLPSVVLEAAKHGILCVSADVGAIASLGIATLHIMPHNQYPNYSANTLRQVADQIRLHLAKTMIDLPSVSYRNNLTNHLRAERILA